MTDWARGFKFGMSSQAVADLAKMAMGDLLRARTRWDEAPALQFAYFEDGAVRISSRTLVDDRMWGTRESPVVVLGELAGLMDGHPLRQLLAQASPETFFGVVFRCETWMVMTKPADKAKMAEMNRAARRRQLHRHPERVESRCAWAMTRVGLLAAFQNRGSDTVDTRPVKRAEGNIPEALTTMFRALVSQSASHPVRKATKYGAKGLG